MTNEEKALELSSMNKYGFSIEESNAAYNAALTMAEWKDEQFKAEKQALIDKACEWLKDNANDYLDWYDWERCRVDKDNLLYDFKKAMEEK